MAVYYRERVRERDRGEFGYLRREKRAIINYVSNHLLVLRISGTRGRFWRGVLLETVTRFWRLLGGYIIYKIIIV